MIDIWSPESFWLTLTNVALGVVCLVLLVVAAVAIVADVREQRRIARTRSARDDHAFLVPGLGETMADGGEPYEPPQAEREEEEPPSPF